jgi:hypothetical protein
MTEDKNIIDKLNEIHQDLVGETMESGLTDLDKIIGILGVLTDKVEELDGHSHSLV